MTRYSFTLSTILVVALFLSVLLIRNATTTKPKTPNRPDTPDAYIINASYIRMNVNGHPANQMYAKKLTHYAKDDVSEIEEPHFILFSQDREPWYVTASYGQSHKGTKQVYLWKNVVIHEPGGTHNRELTMSTSALTVYPEMQSAATDQSVTIVQPGSIVKSVGLTANLHKGEINLLSQAKGVYEVAENKP
jgi:lipopolysaccharide export system protein LptC